MNPRDILVNNALAQVGYKAGTGKHTKYAEELDKLGYVYNGPKNGYDWCDVFVDWCFYKSFGKVGFQMLYQPERGTGAGCPFSADFFREHNAFYETPAIGDQVFFGVPGDEYHTGIVVEVGNMTITTVEGNTGGGNGQVQKKTYARAGNIISGYGRPRWSLVSAAPAKPDKSVDAVAKEVLAGKWGNGSERVRRLTAAGYDAVDVQIAVNKLVKDANIKAAAYAVIAGKYGNGEDRVRRLRAAGYDPADVQDMVNILLRG
jgi:hypothetical protein